MTCRWHCHITFGEKSAFQFWQSKQPSVSSFLCISFTFSTEARRQTLPWKKMRLTCGEKRNCSGKKNQTSQLEIDVQWNVKWLKMRLKKKNSRIGYRMHEYIWHSGAICVERIWTESETYCVQECSSKMFPDEIVDAVFTEFRSISIHSSKCSFVYTSFLSLSRSFYRLLSIEQVIS